MSSPSFLERIKATTDELISLPLNQYFTVPVDPKNDFLENYFDIISQPMDFLTIQNKIKAKTYQSEYEWYKDVCLIYDNAMTYHKSDSIFFKIAEYCSKQFKKKNLLFKFAESTTQEWYDTVSVEMKKLANIIAQSPVPQEVDPFIISILGKAKEMPPVSNSLIPDIVQKINKLMKEKKCRSEIMYIFKELQPSLDLKGDDLEIKITSLLQPTLNAIYLYSRAH